jgi:hypothetical protein
MVLESEQRRLELVDRQAVAAIRHKDIWTWTGVLMLSTVVLTAAGLSTYLLVTRNRPTLVEVGNGQAVMAAEPWRIVHMHTVIAPSAAPDVPLLPPPPALPEQASWREFSQWQQPNLIPLGADQNGPILWDVDKFPHLFVAGMTGSGKTRRIIWPLASMSLAQGCSAIFVNGHGVDFRPFAGHPNATVIEGRLSEMPALASSVMAALYDELERREMVLRRHSVSTWSRLPEDAGEPAEILVIVDEFLSLVRSPSLTRATMRRFMHGAIAITSQGRKFGLRLVFTATSPTERALGKDGLTIRDQCARLCLRVEDEVTSRVVLGGNEKGAAQLPPGEFVTSIGGEIRHGVSFAPNENEITEFLVRHPAFELSWPAGLLEFCAGGSGAVSERSRDDLVPEPTGRLLDAEALIEAEKTRRFSSRHQVARFLTGQERANKEAYDRADAALQILAERGYGWARELLA